jgi:hypothetical protein
VNENLKGLFILASYPSEEVNGKHSVTRHLKELSNSRKATGRVHSIQLAELTLNKTNDLFSKQTKTEKETMLPASCRGDSQEKWW